MSNSFQDHEFVVQWAIRMPDGKLYGSRTYNPMEAFGGSMSIFGPIMGSCGWGDEDEMDEEITTPPSVWYDRKEAERALLALQQQAASMGIEYWGGTIVQRLCSPFTVPSEHGKMVEDITEYLKRQAE